MSFIGLLFVLLAVSLSFAQYLLFDSLCFVGVTFLNGEGKTKKI